MNQFLYTTGVFFRILTRKGAVEVYRWRDVEAVQGKVEPDVVTIFFKDAGTLQFSGPQAEMIYHAFEESTP